MSDAIPLEDLEAALAVRAPEPGIAWLGETRELLRADPAAVRTRFAMAGRKVARGPLDPDDDPDDVHVWTIDDVARTLMLVELGPAIDDEIWDLYRYGDAPERRGLLRALPYLPLPEQTALDLIDDAVRTNDTRLIAAALGPYATEHLGEAAYEHAVLKCVFVGVPIAPLDGLPERATANGSRMLAALVLERIAAGRDVPAEVWPVIDRYPPEAVIAEIEAELDSEFDDRREAAATALAGRQGGVAAGIDNDNGKEPA